MSKKKLKERVEELEESFVLIRKEIYGDVGLLARLEDRVSELERLAEPVKVVTGEPKYRSPHIEEMKSLVDGLGASFTKTAAKQRISADPLLTRIEELQESRRLLKEDRGKWRARALEAENKLAGLQQGLSGLAARFSAEGDARSVRRVKTVMAGVEREP